jgi:hypothetical protein
MLLQTDGYFRAAVIAYGPAIFCLSGITTGLSRDAALLERVKGIEPSFSAWEADVLPLNYTRKSRSYLSSFTG